MAVFYTRGFASATLTVLLIGIATTWDLKFSVEVINPRLAIKSYILNFRATHIH